MAETARPRTDRPVAWSPQRGPQKALVDCPLPEILFGGARGGGKTDGILGKWAVKSQRYGRGFNAVFFRKEMPQQDDLIERAKEIYHKIGGKWQEQKRLFLMPGGGRIRFRPLESIQDAEKYQGQNLSDAAVEEAGNYPMSAPIDRLFGCLRSSAGVPVQLILSANPGGPGHQWIKQRYIDPAPGGMQVLSRDLPNGRAHKAVYIPSRVTDNRILLAQDPGYVDRLHLVGSPNLVKAWLEGDWSVIEGAYFPEFTFAKHVIAPFTIPAHWARIRAMDWGSAKPFCVLWFAVSDGELTAVPRGALVAYREWYGWNGEPNVGCKMTASAVGDGIRRLERSDPPMNDEVLDPAAFSEDGGPSIAERIDLNFRRADNARVARQGAMGGWDQVRERLNGDELGPQLYLFSTCTHLIRTLPALQHDPQRAEDVDTDAEDHACFAAGTIVNGEAVETIGAKTRSDTVVVRVKLADGRSIVCTPDHQFLTSGGTWVRAENLANCRVSSAPRFKSFEAFDIIAAGLTFSAAAFDCIAWCLSIFMGRYLKALTFIMSMRIDPTISLTTCGRLLSSIIWPFTASIASSDSPLETPQRLGMAASMGASGTRRTGSEVLARLLRRALRWCASNAGSLMRQAASRQLARGSAMQTAGHALCVRVELLNDRRDVWCIPSKTGWLDAEGFIASNCDTLRYACMSRPWVRDRPGTPAARFETQLTMNELIKRARDRRLEEN